MRVAVIGAGVSGLAAARRLAAGGADVAVFDRAPRAGGVIETVERDGFLLEKGPDAFLSEKPGGIALCRALGLESEIIATRPDSRRSFIARGGKLHPVPQGFYLTAPVRVLPMWSSPLFSVAGKLRMLAEPLVPARRGPEDESVASFIRRRFGNEALERAGQAMVAGIHTGDPEYLGIDGVLPRFREFERSDGSVLKGLRRRAAEAGRASGPRYSLFVSFRKGMETLARALARSLPPGALRLGRGVSLSRDGGDWTVRAGADAERFDAVLLALPAAAAASLVSESAPALSALLGGIRHESVAAVNLAFRRPQVAHALDGAGFVVPRAENSALVACTFASRKFEGRAPEGSVLLRAFLGGAFGRARLEADDAALARTAADALRPLLGISGEPLFAAVSRHENAMPQYGVGHAALAARIRAAAAAVPGLFVAGNFLGGVGIPDCAADAEACAEKSLNFSKSG